MLRLLDLPNEVLDITFGNLRQPELYSLCLVCRRTYASAKPHLYRDVSITDRKDFAGTGTLNKLRSFLLTIWRNPKLAESVTSLKMLDAPNRTSPKLRTEADWQALKPYTPFPAPGDEHDRIVCEDLVALNDNELVKHVDFVKDPRGAEFMRTHLSANSRCGLLGLILNRLNSRVTTLRIDIERNTAGSKMDPPINPTTGCTQDFVNAKDVTVRGHQAFTRNLVPIVQGDGYAWMPALQSLIFDNLVINDLSLKRGEKYAGLEHLTITNCTLDFDFSNILTPNLRSLAIENCTYSRSEVRNGPLVQDWPCKESIESLTITESDIHASGTFAGFTNLKYLSIDTVPWLATTINMDRVRNLETLLPEGLIGLHLGNCFMDEFPPSVRVCKVVEEQMLALLASRNDGSHPDLEFVEISVNGRHDGRRHTPPKRQMKLREKLQKAFRDAGPIENSNGQLVEIFFTMLCSCVWDCKHVELVTGISAEQMQASCWLAQEPTFKRAGVAVPAA
ncbi:hypothetical protein NA57DRAFT_78451 [Rhizodiscina lignyota]|uniref:F-box domain-containing protein n=1 Tax=Rhizodiscina lignyota TaxID=1504668 RepID=A0A9P4I7X7_9PEZI|nr:hypothetical protein NA57DRAFT_78451 [Rhizodiscina lignyota]